MDKDRDTADISKREEYGISNRAMWVTTDTTVKSSAHILSGIFTEEKSKGKITQRIRTELVRLSSICEIRNWHVYHS